MTVREIVREFRRRWPALRSILRDGTVVYRATFEDGQLTVRRSNSCVMSSRWSGSSGPNPAIYASDASQQDLAGEADQWLEEA